VKMLMHANERLRQEARLRPAAVLFGLAPSVKIHVFSEGKPERRVQLRLDDTTYVEAWMEYSPPRAAEVSITCVADGSDLDDAARRMLTALGILDQSRSQSREDGSDG
jgi:hypothetical protein